MVGTLVMMVVTMVMMGVADSHEDMIATGTDHEVTILASKGNDWLFQAWPWVSLYVKSTVTTMLLTL